MIHRPEDIAILHAAGYICVPYHPLMWRVRGPYEYVEVYPHAKKYRRYAGIMQDYAGVLETVRNIEPYATPSSRQLAFIGTWFDGLESLGALIHKRMIAGRKGDGKV